MNQLDNLNYVDDPLQLREIELVCRLVAKAATLRAFVINRGLHEKTLDQVPYYQEKLDALYLEIPPWAGGIYEGER